MTIPYGYGSVPINTIFRGMNIHFPAILMFTRDTRFTSPATWESQVENPGHIGAVLGVRDNEGWALRFWGAQRLGVSGFCTTWEFMGFFQFCWKISNLQNWNIWISSWNIWISKKSLFFDCPRISLEDRSHGLLPSSTYDSGAREDHPDRSPW